MKYILSILNKFKLNGKVAIMNGAGRGFGKRVVTAYLGADARQLAKAMAVEFADHTVRVNSISPG